MKKLVFLIITILLILIGAFVGYSVFAASANAKGALQITSDPESKVFLNGVEIGKTPLCICGEDTVTSDFQKAKLEGVVDGSTDDNLLPIGEYTIRLVPSEGGFSEFQENITIGKSVLTVVDRLFGKGAASSGSVIMLEKMNNDDIELVVQSIPDGVNVFLDGEPIGQTPLSEKDITESDHELELTKNGYQDKGVRIKTVKGYRLIARIYLGVDEQAITGRGSPQTTPVDNEDTEEEENEEDGTKENEDENNLSIESVTILETGTGFLRVRDSASLAGSEVGRVTPGESYPLLSEETGWYQIEYADGKTGWISSEFAEKTE